MGHSPKRLGTTAKHYFSQNTMHCEKRNTLKLSSERRVLTLVTIVTIVVSGRAQASPYPRPHVWSRGLQLLLLFLTCSVTCSERWCWWGPDMWGAVAPHPAPVMVSAACQVAFVWKSSPGRFCYFCNKGKKMKTFRFDFCEINCKQCVSDSRVKTYDLGLVAMCTLCL